MALGIRQKGEKDSLTGF